MANATPTVDTSIFNVAGPVRISWTNANKGANWYSWRVYRRDSSAGAWTMLKEFLYDAASYVYDDYSAKPNVAQDWAVIRVSLVSGVPTEDTPKTPVATATPADDTYWLIHPYDSSQVYPLYIATSDSFNIENEMAELQIVGRGRKVDIGSTWGAKGSITCQLRDRDYRTGNLAYNSSFEVDSNADGYPDGGWGGYGAGGAGSFITTDYVFGTKSWQLVYDNAASKLGSVTTILGPDGNTLSAIPYRGRSVAASIYRKVTAYTSGTISFTMFFYDAGNVNLGSTSSVSATAVDANWTRLTINGTVPATADHFGVYLTGSATPVATVRWDGLQIELGSSATPWVAAETLGAVKPTARAQLQGLKATQSSKMWYWLRNPFGDITRVAVSNLQVNRIAGVSTNEFADITFQYAEIVP